MRSFIQVAIFIFSFCLAFLLFQWKVEKLRISLKFIISICLAWIVTFAASFFAVDSFFLEFDTPQEAFHYLEQGDVKGIAYGERSCFIQFTNRDGVWSNRVIPWTDGKYHIPTNKNTSKVVYQHFIANGDFHVTQAENTHDSYIWGVVLLSTDGFPVITDSVGSTISCVENGLVGFNGQIAYMYWAYVEDFGDNYEITVNGETTAFDFGEEG